LAGYYIQRSKSFAYYIHRLSDLQNSAVFCSKFRFEVIFSKYRELFESSFKSIVKSGPASIFHNNDNLAYLFAWPGHFDGFLHSGFFCILLVALENTMLKIMLQIRNAFIKFLETIATLKSVQWLSPIYCSIFSNRLCCQFSSFDSSKYIVACIHCKQAS
jgi:hypothetical protein